MAEAFIKLYKKMLKWEWYDDANTCRLFLHCLLKANWEQTRWHGIEIEPGQFITSLPKLAEELHLTIHQVRVALNHLKMTGEVADKGQSKYRIITVLNWDCYQGNGRQSGRQVADKRQTSGRQVATVKEYKEIKEKEELKEYKNKYFPNDEELDKTFSEYVAMRKQIRKPLTDKAAELAIKKLNELSGGDNDKAVKILEQSIMNSWQGLFELKEDKGKSENVFDAWAKA